MYSVNKHFYGNGRWVYPPPLPTLIYSNQDKLDGGRPLAWRWQVTQRPWTR